MTELEADLLPDAWFPEAKNPVIVGKSAVPARLYQAAANSAPSTYGSETVLALLFSTPVSRATATAASMIVFCDVCLCGHIRTSIL